MRINTTYRGYIPSYSAVIAPKKQVQTAEQAVSKQETDTVESNGWEQLTRDTLNELMQKYPDIHVGIFEEAGDLRQMAMEQGKGLHVLISEDFLKEMGSSAEKYSKLKEVLINVFERLSQAAGSATGAGAYLSEKDAIFWFQAQKKNAFADLQKTTNDMMVQQKSSSSPFKIGTKPDTFATSSLYTRLANAKSKLMVSTVVGEAQRNLTSLRLVASMGDEEQRKQAGVAIRSLQRLLIRGKRKTKRLQKEELLLAKQKKAEAVRQREEAKAAQKLNRKKLKKEDNVLRAEALKPEQRGVARTNQQFLPQPTNVLPPEVLASIAEPIAPPEIGSVEMTADCIAVSEPVSF